MPKKAPNAQQAGVSLATYVVLNLDPVDGDCDGERWRLTRICSLGTISTPPLVLCRGQSMAERINR